MKVIILAGGLGTRLSEETDIKPKPMVEIGGRPILWHVMKIYSHFGFDEFIVCCGYKGYVIKEYFANYFLHSSDVTFSVKDNVMQVHHTEAESWKVTLVDTGLHTNTGGRLKRVRGLVNLDDDFCFTYGDGLSNVNIQDLVTFHRSTGKLGTLTAVQPPGRYGALKLGPRNSVESFQEKPVGDGGWISGGFFVVSPKVFELIKDDNSSWENHVLPALASSGELCAFKHHGFWQPMDTLREKVSLCNQWDSGHAPWKVWN